jgi:predicted 2-oxoglutarate/Fe(II)-dependent dioxygenase YbiX
MPPARFFQALGFFVREHFFDESFCAALRAEGAAAGSVPVGVYDGGHEGLDAEQRRSGAPDIGAGTLTAIADRLKQIAPDLERHFAVPLTKLQRPQLFKYVVGDFFKPHVDGGGEGGPEYIRERRVSVVVFLNDESDEARPGTYSGGELTFYHVLDDEHFRNCGLPLKGEEGLLVAFRADVPHEVTAVTRGQRFTIVSWFC